MGKRTVRTAPGKPAVSRRALYLLALDLVLLGAAYYLSFFLLTDDPRLGPQAATFLSTLPPALLAAVAGLSLAGSFRHREGPFDVAALLEILKGTLYSVGIFIAVAVFVDFAASFPRGVFVIYGALIPFAAALSRILWRVRPKAIEPFETGGLRKRRALIVGAGGATETLLGEMSRKKDLAYVPVHIVDDGDARQGSSLQGVKVKGRIADLSGQVWVNRADEIIIALPSAAPDDLRRIAAECFKAARSFHYLPPAGERVADRSLVEQLRSLRLGDLVDGGAPPAGEKVRDLVVGRKILVTGAAGSMGREICRQAARLGPAEIALFDRSGEGLATMAGEIGRDLPTLKSRVLVGDATNRCRVQEIMEEMRPEVVFHADSQREVWLMQENFREGLLANVVGTRTVAEAAASVQAKQCIHLSSLEAMRPGNFTGFSFNLAERVMAAVGAMGGGMKCLSVRTGEVLSEEGGIVPLWAGQIRSGGPVTVSHPKATRCFSTVQRAVSLFLRAAAGTAAGGVVVADPGREMKVAELAGLAIFVAGFVPGEEIEISFSGERPGEKLLQELPGTEDGLVPTEAEGIWALSTEAPPDDLLSGVADMEELIKVCDGPREIMMLARELVPEYRPLGRKRV